MIPAHVRIFVCTEPVDLRARSTGWRSRPASASGTIRAQAGSSRS